MSLSLRRFLSFCILFCYMFALCGCQYDSPEQWLSAPFSAQPSVVCDLTSHMVFSSVSVDEVKSELSCDISGTAQAQLDSGGFSFEGTLDKQQDALHLGTTEMESYYDPQYEQSYSRFGSHYSVTGADTGLGSLVRLPLSLHLDDKYQLLEESELVQGTVCDVYVGTELAAGPELPIYVHGTRTSFSLADIPVEVRLATDKETSLPVQMVLTYQPDGEENGSFTLPDGTKYTLSELSFEVLYRHYGQPVDISVPDGFRQLALDGESAAESDSPQESVLPPPEVKDSYSISTPNHTCGYQIYTPEYMAPETASDSGVSFYYFYSEEDFELIEYNLWEDFSPDDAAAYTKELPQLLREEGSYGDLSSSKVNSLLIDDKQIQYRVLRFQTAENDLLYDGMLIYSWCVAPNQKDVLEVVLWEYNATGDKSFIQPEEELCFAYHYAQPSELP